MIAWTIGFAAYAIGVLVGLAVGFKAGQAWEIEQRCERFDESEWN